MTVAGDLDAGLAALDHGDLAAATAAFERVLEVEPANAEAVVHLAHLSHAAGEPRRAVELLERAAADDAAGPEVLRALLAFAERRGEGDVARRAATRLLAHDPDDIAAALALADLHLAHGDLDDAAAAFARLRRDDEEGHEVFALHGQAEALLLGERWRAALDVAIEATKVDRMQLTTDLLRYTSVKLFGESGDRSAPGWDEVGPALAAQRAAHRRIHDEDAVS